MEVLSLYLIKFHSIFCQHLCLKFALSTFLVLFFRKTSDPCHNNMVGWPWLDARCPPKPLSYSTPQLDGERKHNERLVRWDKDRERSLTSYHHGQNRLNLGMLV